MPARDFLHDAVRNALIRDGWTITHDPLRLNVPGRNLYVDLGAERLLAAERGAVEIAVEVKSFLGPSDVRDLEDALGQFMRTTSCLTARCRVENCTWRSPRKHGRPSSPRRSARSFSASGPYDS